MYMQTPARVLGGETKQMSAGSVRDTIKCGISALGFKVDESTAGVIQIKFSNRASFKNVDTCAAICKAAVADKRERLEMSIGAYKKDIVMNARVGGKRPLETSSMSMEALTDGKDDFYDNVDASISKINKSGDQDSGLKGLTAAKEILYRFEGLRSIDGCGERAVQSFGIFKKKLSSSEDTHLLLAMRINTGTPIRVGDLQSILGESWSDGAFTTDDTFDGVDGVELPLSDEAKVSLEYGNHPLLVITSV
jgi:hypothetical protein